MEVRETRLPGVLEIVPDVRGDDRGVFWESFNVERYAALGVPEVFKQDNVSFSTRGVLRGLHLQQPRSQGKLAYVLDGRVFDVAVDVRTGSEHFGQWVGLELSSESKNQLWVPAGFAHGFCVLSETALFTYKCTDTYAPDCELIVAWNDPAIGIEWPISDPVLSERDQAAPPLTEIAREALPKFEG